MTTVTRVAFSHDHALHTRVVEVNLFISSVLDVSRVDAISEIEIERFFFTYSLGEERLHIAFECA
jgi:hypothetical protein